MKYRVNAMPILLMTVVSGIAFASPIMVSKNGAPYVQLSDNPISDVFQGSTSIMAGICSMNCTLSLSTTITDIPSVDTALMAIGNAELNGSLLCNLVSFDAPSFPWVATAAHSTISLSSPLTIPFNVSGVDTGGCIPCSGISLDITYSNDSGGILLVDGTGGGCAIYGVLQSSDYYALSH